MACFTDWPSNLKYILTGGFIMGDVNLKGFDELKRKLDKLKELEGKVSLTDILNSEFMSLNTKFQSAEEMFKKSGYKIETEEDFKNIPEKDLDTFIAQNTNFESWDKLLKAGMGEWISKQTGL